MLTVEELQKITTEVMTGKEPSIKGPEADEYREKLKKDLKFAEKMGWQVEIPPEWEVQTD